MERRGPVRSLRRGVCFDLISGGLLFFKEYTDDVCAVGNRAIVQVRYDELMADFVGLANSPAM